MTFYRLFIIRTITFLTLFGLTNLGRAQTDHEYDDNEPFVSKSVNFSKLDSNQIRKILTNPKIEYSKRCSESIICYQDSADSYSGRIVRIAYVTEDKNIWFSFETPFHELVYDCSLINIDQKGQSEIVVKGTIVLEAWPRGAFHNDAMIIYQIDNAPKQILKLYYHCNEFNVGGPPAGEGAYDHTNERKIIVKIGELKIKKYTPKGFGDDGGIAADDNCHITDVQDGTYKLINGQFILQ